MPEPCQACLAPAEARYHDACLEALFGEPTLPRVQVTLDTLHTAGLAMAGRMSLPGVQRKVVLPGHDVILKPPSTRFRALPENERVSMRIMAALGLEVPPLGLIPLADSAPAYVVRRFDRAGGRKRKQEDFCQLAGLPPKDKYCGTAELCAGLVRRYATDPAAALETLYRRLVAGWAIGDGDLHLKNLSLLQHDNGSYHLSPAYDAVSTRLYFPDDCLALPVRGRDDQLGRPDWLAFAQDAGLPATAAERILASLAEALPAALALVEASGLPANLQATYAALLRDRLTRLESR